MKKIIHILQEYYRSSFNGMAFVLSILLAGLLTFFAYRHNFYLEWIEYQPEVRTQILRYTIMYLLAFGGGFLLQGIAERDMSVFRSPRWWLLSVLAIVLFAVRGSDLPFGHFFFHSDTRNFTGFYDKAGYNLGGLVLLIVPCFIYWWFTDRKQQPFYGFHARGVDLKPYFFLLSLMLPLLLWAGTQADFLETYPRYTKIPVPDTHAHYKAYAAAYLLAYGSDFVFTEFFFRGFLILAFARWFGHKAVLPMCIFYVTIHFGKPLGETISSFFGGLLLGVIAYRTRSIYGGIIIHLGIAYLMELVAAIGRAGWLHF